MNDNRDNAVPVDLNGNPCICYSNGKVGRRVCIMSGKDCDYRGNLKNGTDKTYVKAMVDRCPKRDLIQKILNGEIFN